MEKIQKNALIQKPIEGHSKAFATKRNNPYRIKTLKSKYPDFQVENVTMGLSVLFFFFFTYFTLLPNFNTAFRTLINVVVIITL